MRRLYILGSLFIALTLVLGNSTAQALPLGTNITIPDKMGYGDDWYSKYKEDQEVEPGNATGQKWDLEGFYFNKNSNELSLVSGYDFSGSWRDKDRPGDLFIDVNGDAVFGPDANWTGAFDLPVPNVFGYDYVLDLDFEDLTYTLIALDEDCMFTQTVWYLDNQESNPWRYFWGGSKVSTGEFDLLPGLDDEEVDNLEGGDGNHYALIFNLADIFGDLFDDLKSFTFHYTMECGNDNLMGHLTKCAPPDPVPEPSTVLLMGVGLLGLAAWGRRKMKK